MLVYKISQQNNMHLPMNFYKINRNICNCPAKFYLRAVEFSSSQTLAKIIPRNIKKTSSSSNDWLTRHLNDPYVKMTKKNHYRARSAFKLIEIDERFKLLKPGLMVVECGAAPGAWTQVIVPKINSDENMTKSPVGKVIAVDLSTFAIVEGATMMPLHDFTSEHTQQLIEEHLAGKKVDLILSDMAPRATGSKDLDHPLIMDLAACVLKFAIKNANVGSDFLCKVWDGFRLNQFMTELKQFYKQAKIVKPDASRSDSSETFILARNFKDIKNVDT